MVWGVLAAMIAAGAVMSCASRGTSAGASRRAVTMARDAVKPWNDTALWEWKVRESRPRIWLDESRLRWIRGKVKGKSVAEVKTLAGPGTEGQALTYALTGDKECGRAAITRIMERVGNLRYSQAFAVAIVYDWCNPLLTGDEKTAMRDALAALMRKEMATGRTWRSFHNGLYTHGVNIGLAAIALAHDDPAADETLEFLKGQFKDVMKMCEILFPDGEWPEGFDYNRVGTYQALKLFWALKTATGADLLAASRHVRNQTNYIIYCAKPDGLVYPGHDNDHPYLSDLDREALLQMTAEFGDRRAQWFINHCNAERFQATDANRWRDLLWYDPTLTEEPPDALPKSRLFRGGGLVVARSGWGFDAGQDGRPVTWIAFHCGKYYGDHVHYDNNHFDLYYRGELAIDSGRYDDDWGVERDGVEVRKSQFFSYYRRSIAHNTILVYDPDERFEPNVVNDGGQMEMLLRNGHRNSPEDYDQGNFPSDDGVGTCDWATNPGRWDTGDILAFKANDALTYVCGDATKSYAAAKLSRFTRQLLFVQPNLVIVFDHVVSTKPDFKKTWLLHSVEEPITLAENGAFEISRGGGRVVCVPVLPAKRVITKVGGPDNEFLVAGIHYACGMKASSGRFAQLSYGETPGAWRIEESPETAATEDFFLNVMQVTDAGAAGAPDVKVLSNGAEEVRLSVAAAGKSAVITFGKKDLPSAALTLRSGDTMLFEGKLPNDVITGDGGK